MERLDRNIGAFNRTLQETPEVLNTVSVNRAVNVVLGMTHKGMLKSFRAKSVVTAVFIGIDGRSRLNCLADNVAYFVAPRFGNHASLDLASLSIFAAFQQTENGGLSGSASATVKNLLAPIL